MSDTVLPGDVRPDPFAVPLSRSKLHAVCESRDVPRENAAMLAAEADRSAPFRAPGAPALARLVQTNLLGLGVVLLFVAAALFLAANWSALSSWWRMGLVSLAVAVAGAVGASLGVERAGGRASVALAGLLTGPLLFVYGQCWQTGADAWNLFAGWAVLLLPFSLIVRSPALFLVWTIVVEVALVLFVDQALGLNPRDAPIIAGLAVLNLAFVLIADVVVRRSARATGDRVRHRWLVRTYVVAALLPTLPMVLGDIADRGVVRALDRWPWEAAALALVLAVLWLRFRRAPKDVFALAGVGLVLVMTAASESSCFLHREAGWSTAWAVFTTGVLTMGLMAVVGAWVRRHLLSDAAEDDEESVDEIAPGAAPLPAWTARALVDAVVAKGAWIDEHAVGEALRAPAQPPLAVRALLGFGIWIGAGMVAGILDIVHRLFDAELVRGVVGAAFFGVAAYVSRRERWGDARIHLTILSTVLAEILVGSVFTGADSATFWVCFAAMQGLVIVVVANPLTRFTATLGMAVALWGALQMSDSHDVLIGELLVLCFAALATIAWTLRDRLMGTTFASGVVPVGYGAAVAAAGLALMHAVPSLRAGGMGRESTSLLSAGLAAAGLFVAFSVRRHLVLRDGEDRAPPLQAVLVAGLVLSALAMFARSTPEILLALLFLFLGHARREKGLYALGTAMLAVALFMMSRDLGGTLLHKAAVLGALGATLLFARLWLLRATADRDDDATPATPLQRAGLSFAASFAVPAVALHRLTKREYVVAHRPVALVALATLFGIGVPLSMAAEKADVALNGKVVLLELVPRDPRSIAQGDYMTLRYGLIEDAVYGADRDVPAGTGTLVFAVDARGVATRALADAGDRRALHENEIRAQYRVNRSRQVQLGAESYFFEEGTGAKYAGAKYGELRVGPLGDVVLVGLRDAGLNAL